MAEGDDKTTEPHGRREPREPQADITATDPTPLASRASGRIGGLPTIDPALYQLGAEIAHGGMGRIRIAKDLRLGREVAIKEVLEPRGELASRFEREAILTSRLQHPSIVAVYEAGRWPTGEPFYAMRLVPGQPLKKVIAKCATYEARLGLLPNVIAIADAMAYAHDQRIIHRDLKPANVLVGDFGETVVIDWGLAKDLDATDFESADDDVRISSGELTMAGKVVGTPNYMSPEQATAKPADERADVYSLGALLYHVLAGSPPYVGESAKEVIAKVASEAPPPITTHLKSIAPDLVAIVERAMSREIARRYPTARELAEDLKRFQTGQLVASHQYSRRELVRRFARRYRTALAVTSVAAIVVGIIGVVAIQRIRHERDVSVAQSQRADRERAAAQRERAIADERADSLAIEQAATMLAHDARAAVQLLQDLSPGSSQLPAARMIAADASSRGIARPLYRAAGTIEALAATPDGKQLAVADDTHVISLVDIATGTAKRLGSHRDTVEQLQFSKDGHVLISRGRDNNVVVWDLATGHGTTLPQDEAVLAARPSPRGDYVIVDGAGSRTLLWEVATQSVKLDVVAKRGMTFVGDDAARVMYETEVGFQVVDVASGKTTNVFRSKGALHEHVSGSATSSNGLHIVFTTDDGTVAIYDVATGTERMLGKHGTQPIYSPRFIPGDNAVVTVANAGELQVWPLDGGRPRIVGQHVDRAQIVWLDVSLDGHHVLAHGQAITLWNLDAATSTELTGPQTNTIKGLRFAGDSATVLAFAGDTVWSWPASQGIQLVEKRSEPVRLLAFAGTAIVTNDSSGVQIGADKIPIEASIVGRVAISPDGRRVAFLARDEFVHVVDIKTHGDQVLEGRLHERVRKFPADPRYQDKPGVVSVRRYARFSRDRAGWFDPVVFSPDGETIAASATEGGTVYLYKHAAKTPEVVTLGDTDVEQLAFAPDGHTLFAAGSDGNVHVIALDGGPRKTFAHDAVVEAMVPSRDGKTLYTASVDRSIRAWDIASGSALVIGKHNDIVATMALTPDGKRLVTGGQDNQLLVWDLAARTSVPLRGLVGDPLAIAISQDGAKLAAGDSAGFVVLWDLSTYRGRTLRERGPSAGMVAISPDGSRVFAGDEAGLLVGFDDGVPATESGLRGWLAAALR
ncbi:MAG TPA: WD40 repeat domain-containing serine/threonine-protein kinase [Kofleriaceae bacterium]|jgi:serine/threonine protein kinase/WD40 repeat protein|nr:WD40 repeat domain-containing serine/threonine-protein kinase [Kofleriaceae bacterium]